MYIPVYEDFEPFFNAVSASAVVVLPQIHHRLKPQLPLQPLRAAARRILVRIRPEMHTVEAVLEEYAELLAGIAELGAHLRHEAFSGFL